MAAWEFAAGRYRPLGGDAVLPAPGADGRHMCTTENRAGVQSRSDLDKSLWLRTGPRQTAHNVASGNRPRFGACCPHQLKSRERTRTILIGKSSMEIFRQGTALITVWLQVRVMPGPPAFARDASKAAAPKPSGRRPAAAREQGLDQPSCLASLPAFSPASDRPRPQ